MILTRLAIIASKTASNPKEYKTRREQLCEYRKTECRYNNSCYICIPSSFFLNLKKEQKQEKIDNLDACQVGTARVTVQKKSNEKQNFRINSGKGKSVKFVACQHSASTARNKRR